MTGVMTSPASRFLLLFAGLTGTLSATAQTPSVPPPAATPALPTLAPAPAPPALGRVRLFEDWAVGCDNRLTCSAVSLLRMGADGSGSEGEVYSVLVSIERAGGPDGAATIEFAGAYDLRGRINLVVDNEDAGQLKVERDTARVTGEEALKLIRRLGSSYALELRQGKTALAAPSLSGLAEALRYIDEVQGRIGSEGALAAIGDGAADQARPLPEPTLVALAADGPPPEDPPTLSAQEQEAARALAQCGGRQRTALPVEAHALDRSHVLALLPCDTDADNVSSIALVASGEPGARRFSVARFDLMPGATGEPGTPPLIVNAQWNPVRGLLSSFARGRPLGDCGTSETYRWDGAMFRLIEARAMPVCRGAWEWPVIWSAVAQDGTTRTAAVDH